MSNGWSASMMLLLHKVNEEVRLYEQAFSPMAQRNVAMSLHERIVEFEAAWKKAYRIVPLPAPLRELDAAARKQAALPVAGHKYDYVSCIGYAVSTGKWDTNRFIANWNTANASYDYNNLVSYSGQATDKADYLARCGKMKDAIKIAYQLHHNQYGAGAVDKALAARDANTLKIFMAPEFFFRGQMGAYDIALVPEIFANLRKFTADAKYKDWLFVLGTVIAASFDDRMVCRNCGKSGAKNFTRVGKNKYTCAGCPPNSVIEWRFGARIDNVALIQKGGETDDTNAHVIAKEYVSHIDFRREVTAAHLSAGKLKTGYDNAAILGDWNNNRRIEIMGQTMNVYAPTGSRDFAGGGSKFTDERMGGSIFTIDGIKFGLEICLDHLKFRLPANSGVQIQLIPSAGAFINSFACVNGGVAFNVDGGGSGVTDVRVNQAGTPLANINAPDSTTGAVLGGGNVVAYTPQAIPYP
jgi:hypothetical protein